MLQSIETHVQELNLKFWRGIAAFGAGSTLTVYDLLKTGSIVISIIGGLLAVFGGWHAFQSQKMRRQITEIELKKALASLDK